MKNQLQFNMSVPPSASNLALRHQVIDPIIVEKIGAVDGGRVMPPLAVNAGKTFQFQALSQDKLDIAVQLAKRDMKKKKLAEVMGQKSRSPNERDHSRSPSPLSRRGTKIVKSREYRERLRQQELKKKKANVLKIRERVGKGILGNNSKQGKPLVSRERTGSPTPTSQLPVTTSSPPTRDYNPRRALTKDELQSSEIKRLQTEIQQFLVKIQDLIQGILDGDMMRDGTIKLRGQDDLHLGQEEGEVRRRLRCEEQATRSSRTVYFLKQQVRGIQEDFTRLGPEKILQVKMTQTLTRLASAHRGAVRALQTFVTQLQNQLPREGPPAGCRELTGLVKQLTTLSSQIVQNGQTDAQDKQTDAQTTVTLLGHIEDLLSVWEEESRIIQAAHKSPERNINCDRPKQSGCKVDTKKRGVLKKATKSTAGKFKPQSKGRQSVKSASPERRAALRAGLAAILREDNSTGRAAGPGPEEDSVNWRGMRFEPLSLPAEHKGILLPPHLQRPRPAPTMGVPAVPSGHFAEPTMSFNLKAVVPQRNNVSEPRSSSAPASPSRGRSQPPDAYWIPPGTPTQTRKLSTPRSRSHSPGCVTCASLNASMEDLSVELFREKRRQKSPKGHVHFASSRSRPRSRSPSPSYRRFPVAQHSEEDIARRLEPLYSQSELLAKKQEAAMRANLDRRRNFQFDSDIDQQTRGEVLSELLFNDLLTNTVEEFQAIQGKNSVTEQAASLMNNPSLEVMVQRLEQMELEQEAIRRRWTSVKFDTEEIRRCVVGDDGPSDPGPLDLASFSRHEVERLKLGSRPEADVGPILFTKVNKPFRADRDRQPLPNSVNTGVPEVITRVPVKLPQEVVMEIRKNVEQYESYLKRTCHHVAGKFDPWQLVKEVSDEIIDDCLTEVAGELEDMSSDIVNHLYTSEFAVTTQDPPSAAPLDSFGS
ncbi:protein moonraker-like [Liolophura sinensis]|uniref:protein moonraker-like n=1 Tax=Liolophura sinensis TaxID=3198878 RepID=UPI0031591CF5